MKVLVTGAGGFIGKNLCLRLRERPDTEVLTLVRADEPGAWRERVAAADAIIHLAGASRPPGPEAFQEINAGLSQVLCETLQSDGSRIPVLLASSTQAEQDNPYGRSKLAAEEAVATLAAANGNPVAVYRLPGVFGKWCKPNYNSVVATFCHNIARDLPITISDPARPIHLVYVDDVINSFLDWLAAPPAGVQRPRVEPEYAISLGELAQQIRAFGNCRSTLVSERVGMGLTRALYATYGSYLPTEKFVYEVPAHGDARGVFVEMLRTQDSGQFSFFSAHPGVTRGGHYHHTKTEKFLVLKGQARFRFRHLLTNEAFSLDTSGDKPQIVETVPGWTHDITNIGSDEMFVMLWANEIFDRERPDTVAAKL